MVQVNAVEALCAIREQESAQLHTDIKELRTSLDRVQAEREELSRLVAKLESSCGQLELQLEDSRVKLASSELGLR